MRKECEHLSRSRSPISGPSLSAGKARIRTLDPVVLAELGSPGARASDVARILGRNPCAERRRPKGSRGTEVVMDDDPSVWDVEFDHGQTQLAVSGRHARKVKVLVALPPQSAHRTARSLKLP
jgi:hypothetical protein